MDWLHAREPVSAWTHGGWLLLCLPAVVLLHRRAGFSLVKQLGLALYSLGLALCFGGSWLYHSVPAAQVPLCIRLDYIGIFLLILGSATPVALVVLRGRPRWSVLALFWAMGVTGITLRILAVPVPDGVSTGLYILMGWTALLIYVELVRRLSHRALRPVLLGGLIYSGGAVLNSLHWPELWPGVFSAHEVSHLCVMAASLCHFVFMLRVIAPFEYPGVAPADAAPDALELLPAPEPQAAG